MGIFGKERAHEREQTQRVIRLPVTGHEINDIIRALSAVRAGEQDAAATHMDRLRTWNSIRLYTVLVTCSERYVKYLGKVRVITLDGDGDSNHALVEQLCGALPHSTRPSEDSMLEALVTCLSPAQIVYRYSVEELDDVLVSQLTLLAALCSLSSQAPAGLVPGVVDMFHGIVAPF